MAGQISRVHLGLSLRAYVGLVEWTGKQLRPGKRGVLASDAPSTLSRLETDPARWAIRVKAIGSGYWRLVGNAEDLMEAAHRLRQGWLKGIGLARLLAATT